MNLQSSIIAPSRQIIVPRHASFLPPGNVQHRRKNYLLGGGSGGGGGGDPFFGDVVMLLQGDSFVDVSSYGHAIVTAIDSSIVADVDFPGGLCIAMNGNVATMGPQWEFTGGTPELSLTRTATNYVCIEGYAKVPVGFFAGSSALFYNDGFGGNQQLVNAGFPVGARGFRINSVPRSFAAPLFPEGVVQHFAIQWKQGENAYWFVNGVAQEWSPMATMPACVPPDGTVTMGIGRFPGAAFPSAWKIAGFRETLSATPRYNIVTGFTPPSLPLPTS